MTEIFPELLAAIENRDLDSISSIIENNYDIDENILYPVFLSQNMDMFKLIIPHVQVENKNDLFFRVGDINLPMALEFFKLYANEFEKEHDMIEYDNYSRPNMVYHYFTPERDLPRLYERLSFNNNKETFAHLLLNEAMNIRSTNEERFESLRYILKHRQELGIKDDTIVRFLIERDYSFNVLRKISPQDQSNFTKLIDNLIDHNISFESDTHGNLFKVICLNSFDIENQTNLIFKVTENGANIATFLEKYNDAANWLTEQEQYDLDENDYNNDRSHDIYTKYEDGYKLSGVLLEVCKIVSQYYHIKKSLNQSKVSSVSKFKI